MLVTCQITKEKIDKSTAYCEVVDGKNKYYKSKEIYDKYKENESIKYLIKNELNIICGISEYVKFDKSANLIYNTKMKPYKDAYKIVYNTLLVFKDNLLYNTQKITNVKSKLLYIFKVIEDNISIGMEKELRNKKQESSEADEELMESINSVKNIKSNKGIDKWLD